MRARWLALVAVVGCDPATNELGYGAALVIANAQFRPGGFPAVTGGPDTVQVEGAASTTIGTFRARLHAVLAPDAEGAIIGLQGADGAWIIAAGQPDFDTPGQPSATATYGFDPSVAPGPQTILLAATDAAGRIGVPSTLEVVAGAAPVPEGDLVVGLAWESTADLDLHVIDPLGGEAWSDQPNTSPPAQPGVPADPSAYLGGGILDHDGNANCHLDNPANEHVIWKPRAGPNGDVAPVIPSGTYTVRVAARSLCRDAAAAWYVEVYARGVLLAAARGEAVPDDVSADQRAGAGVTALTFKRP